MKTLQWYPALRTTKPVGPIKMYARWIHGRKLIGSRRTASGVQLLLQDALRAEASGVDMEDQNGPLLSLTADEASILAGDYEACKRALRIEK